MREDCQTGRHLLRKRAKAGERANEINGRKVSVHSFSPHVYNGHEEHRCGHESTHENLPEDHRFNMEGGSWTNNLSWVRGYENVLDPMQKVSSLFFEKVVSQDVSRGEHRYRNALFHLLTSQTSCYRYWGQGLWTDYAREICRRAQKILSHEF